MSADKHTRIVVTVAVTSSMLVAATSAFAWTFTRFTDTGGYRYCFPLIVYGTIWMLTAMFSCGVAWSLSEQVGAWLAGPKPPAPPPDGPAPRDTPRPYPAPIQPPRPRPGQPPRQTETTLVDMVPVNEVTLEMSPIGVPSMERRATSWRPPVSNNSKENV